MGVDSASLCPSTVHLYYYILLKPIVINHFLSHVFSFLSLLSCRKFAILSFSVDTILDGTDVSMSESSLSEILIIYVTSGR